MKGQGKVKGILVEGNDGYEYLLGFGPDNSPIFSRRQADGTFEPLDDVWRASKVAITQIGHMGGLIGSGMGSNTWLWGCLSSGSCSVPSNTELADVVLLTQEDNRWVERIPVASQESDRLTTGFT